MTAQSTQHAAIRGAVGEPMLTSSKVTPDEFAARIREITRTMTGHAGHRAADAAMGQVLSSLGYCEGLALFEKAVRGWHADENRYPMPPARQSIRCRFGWHRMVLVPSSLDYVWIDHLSCVRCGKTHWSNPCP